MQDMFDKGNADEKISVVPIWSGEFIEVGRGVGIMRVHNSDVRQHFAPDGWEFNGHSTFPDGSLEVYTLTAVDLDHDHLTCPDCGV